MKKEDSKNTPSNLLEIIRMKPANILSTPSLNEPWQSGSDCGVSARIEFLLSINLYSNLPSTLYFYSNKLSQALTAQYKTKKKNGTYFQS